MREAPPMYKIPTTPENTGPEREVMGEIGQSKTEKESKSPLENKVENTANSFTAYIDRMAGQRGGQLPVAEAASIYFNDLSPGLRGKSFSESETNEILSKMGTSGFYDTGKSIAIPTNEGEAKFNLVAVMKGEKPKFALEPARNNDIAERIVNGN